MSAVTKAIHILLLDGRVLCLEVNQNDKVSALMRFLCKALEIKRGWENVGISYRNIRGFRQWLQLDKEILDHDFFTAGEVIQLVFTIRYVLHLVYPCPGNIYQLYLLGVRLLHKRWFLSQSNIHAQLVALHLHIKYGSDLRNVEILEKVSDINNYCSTLNGHHLSQSQVKSDYIINSYQSYKLKLSNLSDYILKFLHILNQCSSYTSQLFVIQLRNKSKCVLGINSYNLLLFDYTEFHQPFKKIRLKEIAEVMHRGVKIVISLKRNNLTKPDRLHRISRSSNSLTTMDSFLPNLESELVIMIAMTNHQCRLICSEIENARDQFCNRPEAPSRYRITDLQNNDAFKLDLHKWLKMSLPDPYQVSETYFANTDEWSISSVHCPEYSLYEVEEEFNEKDFYNSELFEALLDTVPEMKSFRSHDSLLTKPIANYDQMKLEHERIKDLLTIKLIELQENFNMEKSILGQYSSDYYKYFQRGSIPRFIRNSKFTTQSRISHKNCLSTMRSKVGATVSDDVSKRSIDETGISSLTHPSFSYGSDQSQLSCQQNVVPYYSETDLRHLHINPISYPKSNSADYRYKHAAEKGNTISTPIDPNRNWYHSQRYNSAPRIYKSTNDRLRRPSNHSNSNSLTVYSNDNQPPLPFRSKSKSPLCQSTQNFSVSSGQIETHFVRPTFSFDSDNSQEDMV